MVKPIIYLKKQPYYYHKSFSDWTAVRRTINRYRRLRYFYIKGYHKRTNSIGYHLYFDKKVY